MEKVRVVAGVGRSLDAVMGRLQRGHGDPTLQHAPGGWWRASVTPEGPVLLRLWRVDGDVHATATGDGAGWALDQADELVGARDRPEEFEPPPGLVRVGARPELRLGATGLLAESLAPVVVEQRVTGAEAFTSIRRLARRFGTPAPGAPEGHVAARMVCPPDADGWARIPSWEFLRVGVDEGRARTIHGVMARVASIERLVARAAESERGEVLERALRSLPGIGPWTAAKARQQVLGDADAWSVDDYHVPGLVTHYFGGDDAAAAMEPYRPHRYRIELLLMSRGMPERHGPRRSLPTHLPVRGGWHGVRS